MSDKNLVRVLRAVHKLEVQKAPKQHRFKTPQCPSLPRFAVALREGWTPEEREHVSECRYCQKIIAMEWRIQCPSLLSLILHLAGACPDKQAMQYHLDECQRCLRLTQSPWLQGLAALVQAGQRMQAQVEAMLNAVVTAFASLPAPVGAFAPTTRPPFQLRAMSEDGSLIVTLRETDEGELVVHVKTLDPQQAGRIVHVEVIGKGEALTAEVVLQPQGEHGCAGRHTFGKFSELASRLGADCAVLAALTEQRRVA